MYLGCVAGRRLNRWIVLEYVAVNHVRGMGLTPQWGEIACCGTIIVVFWLVAGQIPPDSDFKQALAWTIHEMCDYRDAHFVHRVFCEGAEYGLYFRMSKISCGQRGQARIVHFHE